MSSSWSISIFYLLWIFVIVLFPSPDVLCFQASMRIHHLTSQTPVHSWTDSEQSHEIFQSKHCYTGPNEECQLFHYNLSEPGVVEPFKKSVKRQPATGPANKWTTHSVDSRQWISHPANRSGSQFYQFMNFLLIFETRKSQEFKRKISYTIGRGCLCRSPS
jgi:hypothetical protein